MPSGLAAFGLRARFVMLALAAALPALAVVAFYTIAESERSADEAEEQVLRLADVVARRQLAVAEESRSVLSLLSRNREIGPDDPARCTSFLSGLFESGVINPQTLVVVSVADMAGNLYCSTRELAEPVSVADRRYFQRVVATGALAFGTALTGRASGQPTVPVGYPVFDDANRMTGVLIGGLNLPEVARTALPELRPDAVVTLINSDGLVLGRHPDPEAWVGKVLTEEPLVETLDGAPNGVRQLVGLDGVERIYAVQRTEIGDAEVFAVVGFATAEVYATARESLLIGVAIVLGAALAAVVLGWVLGQGLVSRSVRALADAAARISAGDLSVRVPVSRRGEELASLAEGFNAMAAAIAERETALKESEQRYRQVVDLIPAAIWIHTAGRIVFVNAYAATMFGGGAAEDVIGQEILALVHPDDLPRARERTRRVVHEEGLLPPEELRFRRLDGQTIVVQAQAVRFYRDGAAHVLAAGRDVTAQRAAEEQLRQAQKMEGIGRLSGGIAHDFNNLLTVIIGNLEIALDAEAEGSTAALENALQAAERGAMLTQRLLSFSRRQALAPEPVDLNRLVSGMEDMLRRSVGEDIEIALGLDQSLWSAMVDKGQLETALLNLAVNARDAMPDGGKLTIETANAELDESYVAMNPEATTGAYAMLVVTDTGTGMARDVAERATEPFFTTKEVGKGTGLGLSMAYGFVKQSQGHMKIYSEVGVGTSVRLYLPRIAPGEAERGADRPAGTAERGYGEVVLVVEDEANLRAMVARQLEDLGYRVLQAKDGAIAQDILRTEPRVDLLFTDVVMPGGINGRKLAEDAQRDRPDLRVLFTSGYAETALLHHGRLDNGVHLLSKPFKKQDLARRVRELLDSPVTPVA